jgi:hypothetical protein
VITRRKRACYGAPTDDSTLHNTYRASDGANLCYDLCGQSKGFHDYPYYFRLFFYDPEDLLKVKNGQMDPWEPMPYERWDAEEYIFPTCMKSIRGAAYDRANRLIYFIQPGIDSIASFYERHPVIHVFRFQPSTMAAEPGIKPDNGTRLFVKLNIAGYANKVDLSLWTTHTKDFTLSVHDISGRLIWNYRCPDAPSQKVSLTWNPRRLSSGLYLFRLKSGGNESVKASVVIK